MLAILREAILPLDPADVLAAGASAQMDKGVDDARKLADDDDTVLRVPTEYVGCIKFGTYVKDLHHSGKTMLAYWNQMSTMEISEPVVDSLRNKINESRDAALEEIAAGNEVAKLKVQNLLSDKYHVVVDGKRLSDEEVRVGEALIARGLKGSQEMDPMEAGRAVGWGKVATDAVKAVKRLDIVANGHFEEM
jgi:hypothetical protein